MAEQLWDNERIAEEMRRIGGGTRLYMDDAATVAEQVRDDLQAKLDAANETIAELQDALDGMRGIARQRMDRVRELEEEAQLAERWEPVNEKFLLTYDTGLMDKPKQFARWNADDESIIVGEDSGNFYHCPLPDNIRLCRRKEGR